MSNSETPRRQGGMPATRDELKAILGDLDDATVLEILALNPTAVELQEAAVWSAGDGDILAREGRPLTGIAAQVVEILASEEQDDEP